MSISSPKRLVASILVVSLTGFVAPVKAAAPAGTASSLKAPLGSTVARWGDFAVAVVAAQTALGAGFPDGVTTRPSRVPDPAANVVGGAMRVEASRTTKALVIG